MAGCDIVPDHEMFLTIWREARRGHLKVPLDLGTLHAVMKNMPDDALVLFDGHGHFGESPGDLCSYRGYYEDLSIEPEDGRHVVTVKEFAEKLDRADGMIFNGYKGGEFRMNVNSTVWVSPYGSASGLQITDVTYGDGHVFLHLEKTD
tara:strand:+ start:170 stop:613 length:444 start_codon:yes stop_codon:yes gene_type:complete